MITLVLLASGYGRRFGSNKLFYEIDGKAMYLHTLDRLHSLDLMYGPAGKRLGGHSLRTVVVTRYAQIMDRARSYGMEVVFNEEAAEGIAASVRLGAKAAGKTGTACDGVKLPELSAACDGVKLPELSAAGTAMKLPELSAGTDGWIAFFTADQPFLEMKTIEGFLKAALCSGKTLATVCHDQVPGSPTLFREDWLHDLLTLRGDQGGRLILKQHPLEVFRYEISEREITDIDFPGECILM